MAVNIFNPLVLNYVSTEYKGVLFGKIKRLSRECFLQLFQSYKVFLHLRRIWPLDFARKEISHSIWRYIIWDHFIPNQFSELLDFAELHFPTLFSFLCPFLCWFTRLSFRIVLILLFFLFIDRNRRKISIEKFLIVNTFW